MNVSRVGSRSRSFRPCLFLACIAVLFSFSAVGRAQSSSTNIQISDTVQQASVSRLGVNLSDQTFWDSGQMMKNLIFENPGFEGLKYREIFQCAEVTGETCKDNNQWNVQPAGFWNGGSYQIMSGNSAGARGTVVSNTAASACPGCGPEFHFDKSMDLAPGDYFSVEIYIPGSGDAGWSDRIYGGGKVLTETTDLSPETPGKQALVLSAGRVGQSVTVTQGFAELQGLNSIQLNGTFQVAFRAKGLGGNNQLSVNLERQSSGLAPYLSQTVKLTNTWQDFVLNFSADDSGPALGQLQLSFTASGANAELDDVSLAQADSSPFNPTVFRDEVVDALKELNPGTIRMTVEGSTLGSDLRNQLQVPFARYREGFSAYETSYPNIPYGIPEILQLCATVGADPWITIPTATTPQEMTDFIEYLTGIGLDPWSALRIARGQTAPWTSVFNKIHIELGSETWNGSFAGELMGNPAYSQWANEVFGAARQVPDFNAGNFDLILSGSASLPGYNASMLASSTQHDSLDIAPYLLLRANNESQAKMFGALFAEPELFESPGGTVYQNMQVGAKAQSATEQSTNIDVSETNLSPIEGNITQAQLNQLTPSLGAGIAQTEHMLQMMRAGVKYLNAGVIPRGEFSRTDGSSVKLLGGVSDVATTDRRGPQFLTQALANSVIGGDMLQTVQSGANPTWNQPLSSDNVRFNGAHYLQSFAFLDDSSASVIVFNLDQTSALPVTFSGPNAPSGTVQMTQIASAKITDNNESSALVQPATQTLSSFNPATPFMLPPFSMTLLRWTVDPVQAPIFSLPAGTYNAAQTVALSTTTPGATIYYTTNGITPTTSSSVYSVPLVVSSSQTLEAIAVLAGSTMSPVATAVYIVDPPGAAPILSTTPVRTAAPEAAPSDTEATSQTTAQTTVTISNTVSHSGLPRFGVNMGSETNYGQGQALKDLTWSDNAYFSSHYWQTSFTCDAGGTQSTTQWYNGSAANSSSGYPANFWVGATYIAVSASTGALLGTGTITASTSNQGSSGIEFTLGTALSSACNSTSGSQDMLIVKLTNASPTLFTPAGIGNGGLGICSSASWDTTDTDPASSNTIQSLEMPTGCTLTFYIDSGLPNATNTNSTLAAQGVSWLNLNGSYTATFMAKCPSASGASTLTVSLGRSGGTTYIPSTNETLTCNPTAGAGWTTFTIPFTANETGAQGYGLVLNFSATGTVLIQEAHVIEGSTLPGNTTPYRDSVVRKLQALHPGSLRFMDGSDWCSDVADMTGPAGNNRGCDQNEYVPIGGNTLPVGYSARLQLCAFVGADCWITVGQFNRPSDWTSLINWLSTSGWISTFAASGHKIYLEEGNEAWNNGAPGGLWSGGGYIYGYFLGPNMAAAKEATGYNSSVIKFVGDGFTDGGQGIYSWTHNVLTKASGTANGLPDFIDNGTYMLDYLATVATSGGNVSTTGAPWPDETAEIVNYTEAGNTTGTSVNGNTAYAQTFGVNMAIYEANFGLLEGSYSPTENQIDQIAGSVGTGLFTAENFLLMQRDAGVVGPINLFTLSQNYDQYNFATPPYPPLWGVERYMACGPGQLSTCADVDRPTSIALQIVNNAIGANNNLMSITQSGTPTFSYPGGQPNSGTNSIQANSAVPYVNCFSYANSAQANWTTICFNNNLTTAESVTLAGAGAPTGPVSETLFPGPSNLITDNNENTYVGTSSVAPVVTLPSATTTSGTTYSIPPASFIALTYTVVGTSTLATPTFSPGAGSYSATQTVTITFPAGSTGCVGINTTPTAPTPGTCGAGGTTYSGPITVNASETLNAIATEAGATNSSVGTATFTITIPTVTAPTFTPAAGSYTSSQSVTISDATTGATIYYTTNGSTPTTASSIYGGPITVSSSETLEAIAVETGYTASPAATAAYTISPALADSPAPPSGMLFWGRGDSLTCTGGCAGTNVVTAFVDKSGNGNNASGSTAATYVASGAGSQPAVEFNGTSASLFTFGTPINLYTPTNALTVCLALQLTSTGSKSSLLSGPFKSFNYEFAYGGSEQAADDAYAALLGRGNAAADTSFHSMCATYNGTTIEFYIDGSTDGSATPGYALAALETQIGCNGGGGSPSECSKLNLYDIAIYNSALPATGSNSIATWFTYTNDRYGSGTAQSLTAPTFTVTVDPGSLTVASGQSGSTTVVVTPQNSFAAPVSFSCSGLPSGASCSFSPATVTPVNGTASTTLTVTTATTTTALRRGSSLSFPGSTLAIALCLLGWKKRRTLPMLALVVLALSVCNGCGLGGNQVIKLTTNSTVSTVTVIATSGSLKPSTTLTLTLE